MHYLIKAWFKYFIVVGLFGFCANLIYLAFPVYIMVTYDRVLYSLSHATLYSLALGMLISLLIMALLDYLRARMLQQAGWRLAQDLTPRVFAAMQAPHPAWKAGEAYTRGLADLECLTRALVQGQLFRVLDWPWVLVYAGSLFLVHPFIGLIAGLALLMQTLFQVLLQYLLRRRTAVADVALAANADFARDCFSRAELVQGLGLRPTLTATCTARQQEVLTLQAEAAGFQATIGTLIRLLSCSAPVAVFTAGIWLFFQDQITVGAITAALLISIRLFQFGEHSLARLKPALEARAAWQRLKEALKLASEEDRTALPPPQGHLEVEGLTLSLNGRLILQQINLNLAPGASLGIIGPAAGGKSALCKALLGLWSPSGGRVRLDGADITQWPREELGPLIGWLPQPAELFPFSVADNIARLGAVTSEEDSRAVIQAAEAVGAHDMILQLPQGYDTLVREGGINLAASQRQSIALARALYGQPRLVVLDAPNTHLDDAGLKRLDQLLKNLKAEQVTTIIVTDRPSLLGSMDQLLVLKEGRTALYGPTAEVYKQLTQGSG